MWWAEVTVSPTLTISRLPRFTSTSMAMKTTLSELWRKENWLFYRGLLVALLEKETLNDNNI